MRRALVAAGVLALLAVVGVVVWRALDPVLRAAENGRRVRQELLDAAARVSPRWRADVDALLADDVLWSVLLPAERTRDAAGYLHERVVFSEAPAPDGAVGDVPWELETELYDRGDDVFAKVDELDAEELAAVDTSWMRPLPGFTHWDLDAHPARVAKPAEPSMTLPRPEVMSWLSWARVRLVEGIVDDDLDAASAEVRALARLLWGTGEPLHGAMAAKLLELDDDARRAAAELKVEVATPRIPSVRKLEKVVASSFALYSALTPPSIAHHERTDVRFCGALGDGASTFLLARDALEPRYPERARAIREALDASPCALERLKRQWDDGTGNLPLNNFSEARGISGWLGRAWLHDTLLAVIAIGPHRGYFADALADAAD